jgi:peptidoglycan LD-endopeptidase LytH
MAARRPPGSATRKRLLIPDPKNLRKLAPWHLALLALCFLVIFRADCSSAALPENEGQSEQSPQAPEADGPCRPCLSFNDLDKKVRDGRISRSAAMAELPVLLSGAKAWYYQTTGRNFSETEWVFPVEGYTAKAIGAKGRGYKPKGYDYFDGNRHKAHPSQDIFIRDKNQDQMDDITRKPVRVLSMTGGIVVATEPDWEPGSKLRGGKYIWIYSPADNALVYYAHNRELLVNPGDIVKPGDAIATMGRTGLSAYKPRSPTHLHITYLKLKDGYPIPVDIYGNLLKAVVGR